MEESTRELTVNLDELSKAWIQYDEASDTLYIHLSDEEPDETLLLENDIVLKLKSNRIISITILNLFRRIRE